MTPDELEAIKKKLASGYDADAINDLVAEVERAWVEIERLKAHPTIEQQVQQLEEKLGIKNDVWNPEKKQREMDFYNSIMENFND